MGYEVHDTIAAIASPAGGAARGIVRISGPNALECVTACFVPHASAIDLTGGKPVRIHGAIRVAGDGRDAPTVVPGSLFIWPNARSYTREAAAEFHTVGSQPLLAAVLEELCRNGARPAEPGEFTLRAFLAGRIDLTQAEAVLGVVDAQSRDDLDVALDQLAGGLSRPLHDVRERLLGVLAELEAGLDFADEPIEFIGRHELLQRTEEGRRVIAATIAQLSGRGREDAAPRVVLVGRPNVGKSSLFNALTERFGIDGSVRSLVSPIPGATRDYVSTRLDLDGIDCELIDAAGDDSQVVDDVERAAQQATAAQRRLADLRVQCVEQAVALESRDLVAVTKIDLPSALESTSVGREADRTGDVIRCSSVTGAGLDALATAIRRRIANHRGMKTFGAATALRCLATLREADRALAAAERMCGSGSDELLAAEVRIALQTIGEVVGAVCADDVLDRVFRQFCIGK
jgi:tRNA modification GTPase